MRRYREMVNMKNALLGEITAGNSLIFAVMCIGNSVTLHLPNSFLCKRKV
jgi:hypothetical protein